MQSNLDFLLKKYAVQKKAVLAANSVIVNDKTLPLLPWRSERRIAELKKLISDGELTGISTMRTLRIVKEGTDLYDVLFREVDICRYILGTEFTEIFAVANGNDTLNAIAATAAGYVCTLELSATLHGNEKPIDKHEIIAIGGVACDRAADTQVPQSSVYVYNGKPEPDTYTDVDAELYGLEAEDCAIVRAAFEIVRTETDLSDEVKADKQIVEAAKRSVLNVENIIVGR